MSILYVRDVVQMISQYSPHVYCSLRLVDREVKEIIDEVLPTGSREIGSTGWIQSFLINCSYSSGFLLLEDDFFEWWIDGMVQVLPLFESEERPHGAIVEKFCRDYQSKIDGMVGGNAVELLAMFNQESLIREYWKDKRLDSNCLNSLVHLKDPELFKLFHEEVKNVISKDLVKVCIETVILHHRWAILKFLWNAYENDKEINLCFSKAWYPALKHEKEQNMDPILRKDKGIMLESMKEKLFTLELADETLLKDRKFMLDAVNQNGYALSYADASLKKDKEIVAAALNQHALALKFADKSLRKEKNLVLAAVRRVGYSLEFADESLRKDKEVVLEAMRQDRFALRYADESLKNDKSFVLELVGFGDIRGLLDESLRNDEDVSAAFLKAYGRIHWGNNNSVNHEDMGAIP